MPDPQQQPSHSPQNAQDPVLISCWQIVKADSHDLYIKQQRIIQWVNRVLTQKNQIIQKAQINVQQKLHQYMKQVHQLDRSSITNVSFKYEQAVDFYNWFIMIKHKLEKGYPQQQQNGQKDREQQQDNQKQQKSQQVASDIKLQQQQKIEDKPNNLEDNDQEDAGEAKNNEQQVKQSEETFLYPRKAGKGNYQQKKQKKKEQNQFSQQKNQDEEQTGKQQKQLSKNYRQYLNTVFDHYCRMSYATGNDPTFQQIQQKTQVMTINKFMIFCKEFGIIKLNNMSRTNLVEIFKKNSECYKDMNFQQFILVLLKISFIVYSPDSQAQQTQSSKQFQQLLLFLQVNNFSSFKKKIQSLNISLKPKGNQNPIKKIVPSNYKFKFSAQNGKRQQEKVKEQVQQRKRIRSQHKFKVIQTRQKNSSSKKEIIKIQPQLHDRNQVKTNPPPKKQLQPPLPPVRRIPPPNTNKSGQDLNSVVTGYANIHKLKKMGKQGNFQSRLRLNNVVQEAKKMLKLDNNYQQPSQQQTPIRISTHGRDTPYSNYSNYGKNNLNIFEQNYEVLQSQNDRYSQRDIFDDIPISKRSYVPHGHSKLQKKLIPKQNNDELKGIIDNDSDEDEYLQEHLNREKKSGPINQRIQKKIKQYEQKILHT